VPRKRQFTVSMNEVEADRCSSSVACLHKEVPLMHIFPLGPPKINAPSTDAQNLFISKFTAS
jgi:hypothetical protein